MTKLKVGDIIEGKVTGIEEYGIFVSVEDYSGLIHISEISHGFVKRVSNYAMVGENIVAKIISIDEKNKKLKLSIKVFEDEISSAKREKIAETGTGFEKLQRNLETWIKDKNNQQ